MEKFKSLAISSKLNKHFSFPFTYHGYQIKELKLIFTFEFKKISRPVNYSYVLCWKIHATLNLFIESFPTFIKFKFILNFFKTSYICDKYKNNKIHLILVRMFLLEHINMKYLLSKHITNYIRTCENSSNPK